MPRAAMLAGCELLLSTVFIWAAIWKWTHPEQSAAFLSAITPIQIHTVAIKGFAVLEWGLGLWLLTGICNWGARLVAGLFLLVFSALLVFAAVRGVEESCGCLGLGESIPWALTRNAALLLVLAVASAIALSQRTKALQGIAAPQGKESS